jgi:hypothetical membrane protein
VVASAAVLPTVLTAAWLVADSVQPPSYSPLRQTVSTLSGYAGTDRWLVTSALYVIGIGYLVTAAGLSVLTREARAGLVVAGVAAIGIASFPEPVHGTDSAHAVFTAIGAVTIAIWPALADRHPSVRAALGRRTSIVAIGVSIALFGWTAIETHAGDALGLAERLSSAVQACWPLVVVLALRRAASNRQDDDEWPAVGDRGIDSFGYPQRAPAMGRHEQPRQQP